MTSAIGPSTYGSLDRLLASAGSLQERYEVLQQQTTTGKISQSYAGLAGSVSQVLDLTVASNQSTAYTQTIATAQGKAAVMQDSLTQINAVVSQMAAQSLSLVGSSSANSVDNVAQQAKLALQQIASLLNAKYANDYVFAGADTSNPPVPSPETITSSGMFMQIGTQVNALSTAPTTPAIGTVIGNTVTIASSTTAGTTVFSNYLTGPGASAGAVTIQIAESERITLDLPANRNVGAVSDPGIAGTGSAINDIMRSLSLIANSTGAIAANPDFAALMKNASTTLTSARQTLSEEGGQIGLTQASMTAAAAAQASLKTILDKQLSGLTDADMASAISKLQAVNTQLQASYKILSLVRSLNLASFL